MRYVVILLLHLSMMNEEAWKSALLISRSILTRNDGKHRFKYRNLIYKREFVRTHNLNNERREGGESDDH